MSLSNFKLKEVLNAAVVVAALGYFVDVYDLVLFLIIGKKSLKDLGIAPESMIPDFQFLLNLQMIGMLVGGLFWGVLGDKKGRLSVLFGSIITYSLANVANGFVAEIASVTHIPVLTTYAILRFVAGLGLAGELGAGVTLVSETMSKETRGYGTMLIASIGVIGAVVAALVSKIGWQLSYFIGGGLGFSLLLLRIGVFESGMFSNLTNKQVKQGQFFFLFATRERAFRYINSILIGLPVWFIIGILVGRAPEIAKVLHVRGEIDQGVCVMLCYTGLVFGDLGSGLLSQLLRSRKRAMLIFYALCVLSVLIYLNLSGATTTLFYTMITCLGFSVGFWAIFVTGASEQFGTNLRSTVTTTVPNFVRGSLVLVAIVFDKIYQYYDNNPITAGLAVTLIVVVIAALALSGLKETFGKDLDYLEK